MALLLLTLSQQEVPMENVENTQELDIEQILSGMDDYEHVVLSRLCIGPNDCLGVSAPESL